jgi:hypothetical protein
LTFLSLDYCIVISRHIGSIFKDDEVDKKSNMQKMHIANSDKPVNTKTTVVQKDR